MVLLSNLFPAIPEIFVLIMTVCILLYGVFSKNNSARAIFYLAQITIVLSALLSLHLFHVMNEVSETAFSQLFILDKLAVALKVAIDIAMFFTFWYSWLYNEDNKIPSLEFHVLGLLAMLGMMLLVSSNNFVTLFLSVELMSLPVYAMVALERGKLRCIEAAMKYFIIGAVASALLLYGISIFFGATQSFDLLQIATAIAQTPASQSILLYFGLIFVIAGIAFKLGAAPFHLWVPDVYDGAPNSVTLFISAAPKLAAFGFAIRFFLDAAPGLHVQWDHVLIVLALLSIAIGNLAAIMQSNIKRLLAYSSIAHMGFMLLGLACGTTRGDAAALFYMITYALMSLGVFGIVALLSKTDFDANELSDFAGLSGRNPWLAFMMMLLLFSLAGLPPFVGFIAKIGILEALIKTHDVWIAVVAIIFAIIGVYYYIRVIKVMYFEEASVSSKKPPIRCSRNLMFAISVNGLAVLLLGIFPSQLFLLCHAVFN
ncbi:MAG: NADH-quinone oxidoreductase subunit N [Gammaproteobacteria bacterium RIFCSPHIGHO2_01_FULL_42_8]|nr:MAG: NADH-quinone oxidoreductase subunit N [Gammaproteobacteria bacterium RIFCSPHIGHO2_01_FULL_42_8]